MSKHIGKMFGVLACLCLATLTVGASPALAASCSGPLTGRMVTVPVTTEAFGAVQGGKMLKLLRAGEFALSFDDGPNPMSTEALIDILDRYCVHAAFMEVGNNAVKYPDLSRFTLAHGETLGSHSRDHKNFSAMTPDQWHADILEGADAVETAGTGRTRGDAWRFFRIPGATGVPLVAPPEWVTFLQANHLILAGYDASGDDWKNPTPEASFNILMTRLKHQDRGVIVMHEGQSNTPAFLTLVLAELEKRGAKVVLLRPAER